MIKQIIILVLLSQIFILPANGQMELLNPKNNYVNINGTNNGSYDSTGRQKIGSADEPENDFSTFEINRISFLVKRYNAINIGKIRKILSNSFKKINFKKGLSLLKSKELIFLPCVQFDINMMRNDKMKGLAIDNYYQYLSLDTNSEELSGVVYLTDMKNEAYRIEIRNSQSFNDIYYKLKHSLTIDSDDVGFSILTGNYFVRGRGFINNHSFDTTALSILSQSDVFCMSGTGLDFSTGKGFNIDGWTVSNFIVYKKEIYDDRILLLMAGSKTKPGEKDSISLEKYKLNKILKKKHGNK